jgi:hypothetical protein
MIVGIPLPLVGLMPLLAIEGIPLPLIDLTPWGLLGLGFLLLMTGKLIPVATHRDVIAQRDHWQGIAATHAETNVKHVNAIGTLGEALRIQTEAAEFSRKVMEAVQKNAEGS